MSYRKTSTKQYDRRKVGESIKSRLPHQAESMLEAKVYANKWNVTSHSDLSKTYTVSLTEDGQYECSCPAWIYARGGRKECKHIQEIKNRIRAESSIEPIKAKNGKAKKSGTQLRLPA